MEKKVKILLITLGVLAVGLLLMLALREPVQAPQTAPAPVQVENQEDAKKDESVKQAENLPSRVTAVASGTVIANDGVKLDIQVDDGSVIQLKSNEKTSFYALEKDIAVTKFMDTIKKGDLISAEYDISNKEILTARVN